MDTFSLRAECMADADALRKLVTEACPVSELTMSSEDPFPDQDIEIRTELETLQTLLQVPLAENSLERDYERM